MVRVEETTNDAIPLELDETPVRFARLKRKKSILGSLLPVVAGLAVLAALGGAGWWIVSQGSAGEVTILSIADQEVSPGDKLKIQIPVSVKGYSPQQLSYELSGAPPGATFDKRTGVLTWTPRGSDEPGTYQVIAKVTAAGRNAPSDEKIFTVRLRGEKRAAAEEDTGPTFEDLVQMRREQNPFEIPGEVVPETKIDQLVFAKLKQLNMKPAKLCSDSVFVRRAYLDVIGTLPTAAEASGFLEDKNPKKRSALIDYLLERPEYADYWALHWCDTLRVKSEFPINLWPNAAQAYDRWVRASLRDNMPYDQFARELLTSCGSNFRTAQVNFFRAVESKTPPGLAKSVALVFLGERAENWPKERLDGMAAFFSQVGYKPSNEWKEEIVVWDPRKAKAAADGTPPPKPVFPDGTPGTLPPGKDPREVFADWLIRPDNPWFTRQIVNRQWYWLLGRGIVHEPDDVRPDNPAQNPELLNYLADELVNANYDLKHVFRLILNSKTYQLSFIPQSDNPASADHFAFYPMRRLDAEVLIDAICQITGTTESYSSIIPEPYTFVPEIHRTQCLPDGSITSAFLEMFGRPSRDSGLESERNNRITANQRLHLLNSTHIRDKITKGPKLLEIFESTMGRQTADTLYLAILSRLPTDEEWNEVYNQCNSRWGAQNVAWALINSEEFLFRH